MPTVAMRPACTSFSFASASASRPARAYGGRAPAASFRATVPAGTTGEPWLGRPVKLSVSRRISIRIAGSLNYPRMTLNGSQQLKRWTSEVAEFPIHRGATQECSPCRLPVYAALDLPAIAGVRTGRRLSPHAAIGVEPDNRTVLPILDYNLIRLENPRRLRIRDNLIATTE